MGDLVFDECEVVQHQLKLLSLFCQMLIHDSLSLQTKGVNLEGIGCTSLPSSALLKLMSRLPTGSSIDLSLNFPKASARESWSSSVIRPSRNQNRNNKELEKAEIQANFEYFT